jgi:hypothetical protein
MDKSLEERTEKENTAMRFVILPSAVMIAEALSPGVTEKIFNNYLPLLVMLIWDILEWIFNTIERNKK